MYKIIGLVFMCCWLFSCSYESDTAVYLPELSIEIPQQLSSNPEVKVFVDSCTMSLNTWSIRLEDLAVAFQPYSQKSHEELSVFEKLKLAQLTMKYMAEFGQFSVDIAEMQQSAILLEDGFSENELVAFEQVARMLFHRISELTIKYKKLDDNPA